MLTHKAYRILLQSPQIKQKYNITNQTTYLTKSICFKKFQPQMHAKKRYSHNIGKVWSVLVSGPNGVHSIFDLILAFIFWVLHGISKVNRVEFWIDWNPGRELSHKVTRWLPGHLWNLEGDFAIMFLIPVFFYQLLRSCKVSKEFLGSFML
jgi:hypothetical protein